MLKKAECQFCKKVITLEVSDDYADTRDPYKLLAKAACDRCADLRYRRRNLTEALVSVVSLYKMERRESGAREKYGNSLERITKKYCALIADWYGTTNRWDREVVESILDRPDSLSLIIGAMWKTAKDKPEQPELGVK